MFSTEAAALPSPLELGERELIAEWLLDLHLVRHPVGTDARLATLLRLLVARFGIRTAEGYRLPYTLGHACLAELICTTRSTVTRQLVVLRQTGQIRPGGSPGSSTLSQNPRCAVRFAPPIPERRPYKTSSQPSRP